MSKTEILEELPKLNLRDRLEVFSFLCDLEESNPSSFPSVEEKCLLDKELENYYANPHAGSPWNEVRSRVFITQ